ncbi:MAG: hypothetical protein CVV56_08170 [Tenericutes bacterium HGW-Tenericutes-1]|nr:MAG: hypothetical protein CVV56_08170 [Tenericutes bacterium HGW-Tenericutes-1]PKM95821.1 MAG: hypothetical protein CVU84_03200 [Firmicutes bacterium HGW-Firmicutes-1]
MLKKKKEGLFSKLLLLLVIALNIWFTNRVLNIVSMGMSEPVVLIGSWFLFTGTEVWIMANIKKQKIKKENGDNNG